GKVVNSTGRTRYSETISTVTDIRMSATINRSNTNPGSGVISAIMMASTAIGTARSFSVAQGREASQRDGTLGIGASVLAGVILTWQLPVHELENVCEYFGHGFVEMRRDFLAHI